MSDRTVAGARRLWGFVYLRAAAYLIVGVVLFVDPERGLTWLRWLLAAVIFVQGVLLTAEGAPQRNQDVAQSPGSNQGAGWRLVVGVISIVAAVVIAVWPSLSMPVLVRIIGIWACVAGVLGGIAALRSRRDRTAGWDWHLVNAALWLVLGVVMLTRPAATLTETALLLALYLVMAGIVLAIGAYSTGTAARDRRGEARAPKADAPEPDPT